MWEVRKSDERTAVRAGIHGSGRRGGGASAGGECRLQDGKALQKNDPYFRCDHHRPDCGGILFYFIGYPAIRYQGALDDLNAGNYAAARDTFSALGDYKDSASYVTESNYLIAKQTAETDLINGLALLEGMGAYKDSVELAAAQKNKIFEAAKSEIAAHSFEKAEEYLNAIPDMEGVAEQRKELAYQRGLSYEEQCDYGSAQTEFEQIRGYKDVDERLNSLNYQLDGSFIQGVATAYGATANTLHFWQDSGRLTLSMMLMDGFYNATTVDESYYYWIEDNVIYGTAVANDDYSSRPSRKPTEEIGRITDIRRNADGTVDAIQISGLLLDEPVWFE